MAHRLYTLWSPVYDWFAGPLFVRFREESVRELGLSPGQSLLMPGVGSGLDFPFLPKDIKVTGFDLNRAMLARARKRAAKSGLDACLEIADAERLPCPDAAFDAAYVACIACVAEHGDAVLREALRAVKPGGTVVLIDKFLGESAEPGLSRRAADRLTRVLFSHINRRWSDVSAGVCGFALLSESAGPLGGFFRRYVLRRLAT